jgi:hypothetical protein
MIVAPDGQPFGEQNPAYRSSLAPFLIRVTPSPRFSVATRYR